MYGGDGPTLAQPAPDESKKPEGEEKEGGQTFLLNKDISPDFQVGEEMVVKIVAVHDKEYEVELPKLVCPGHGRSGQSLFAVRLF